MAEKNRTDPRVCHDPSIKLEGITRMFPNQNKVQGEDGEVSSYNIYESLKIEAIEYPLVTINNRNIENHEIVNMIINYNSFIPTISITVIDQQESEQKIFTTQMSSLIKVVMISPVDKVYKKILLNFRILNASIDSTNSKYITYYGEYYVEGFRQINTKHIWMETVCPKPITCEQGAHINANTWEMLHKIAELTGLGFAATKKCKEIPDHIVRHIHTQRFNDYIEQQLLFSGTDKDNIFDAWVDLYGYIVMINVPWVIQEEIKYDELTIVANGGAHSTTNDLEDQNPVDTLRILSNYNLMGMKSNLEIESYYTVTSNEAIVDGTLERIYPISLVDNERFTKLESLDIQTKQNSIDGEYIEDYNTGKVRPIPKFNFNDDLWTGLTGGYDIHLQKKIRTAFFKKMRQSLLYVKLKTINFGLQRGTLINIAIFENDARNKDFMIKNGSRLLNKKPEPQEDKLELPPNMNIKVDDLVSEDPIWLPNYKLSGMYYIDGMKFEYNPNVGKIDQILILMKKGSTSGYMNRHNGVGLPIDKYTSK